MKTQDFTKRASFRRRMMVPSCALVSAMESLQGLMVPETVLAWETASWWFMSILAENSPKNSFKLSRLSREVSAMFLMELRRLKIGESSDTMESVCLEENVNYK